MKKRIISILLAVTMLSATLAGCGGDAGDTGDAGEKTSSNSKEAQETTAAGTDSAKETGEEQPSGDGEPVKIKFLNRWAEDTVLGAAIYKACQDFMEANPNVEIEYDAVAGADDTQFYEKMKTAAATGDMYELFQNYGGSTIYSYVESDVLYDLTSEFENDKEWKDNFLDLFSMWEYQTKEGVYGVPFTDFATVLYCNKDMFESRGLKYPETISEFEAVCDKFLEEGITPVPMSGEGWRFAHLLSGLVMRKYGEDYIYDLANGKEKYTGDKMLELVNLMKSWQDKGYFGENIASLDSATEQALFSTEKSPMIAIGTWQPTNILENNPEFLERKGVDVIWFPAFEDKMDLKGGSMGGPNEGLSIAKKDEATTAATVKLVKYLTSPEVVTEIWKADPTQIFAVKSATPPEEMNYLTKECIDLINNTATGLMQEIDQYSTIASLQDRLRNSLAGMVAGNAPEAAMKEVQDEIDSHN